MKKSKKVAFDPKIFLAKMADGKTISKYQKNQIVFSQSNGAVAAFYIQKGKIKLAVVSERGKEAVVGVLEPGHTGDPNGPVEACPVMRSHAR